MAGGSTTLGETSLKASCPALSRRRQTSLLASRSSFQTRVATIESVHIITKLETRGLALL
jgi:hypothetical protein